MVIIIGDSWGVGEWDQCCNLGGPGFGQYMMLHDQVINLSLGAGSNTDSLTRLEVFLEKFQPDVHDTFYWVVTCPSRYVTPDYYVSQCNGLMAAHYSLLDLAMSRANTIAQKYNITIKLIGGLCDLDTVTTNLYPMLSIQVPSWGLLLNSNYKTWPGYPWPNFWAEVGQLSKKNNNLTQEWIDISDCLTKKTQCWESMKSYYFSTDGEHPDRHGHLILRNHLYPEWSSKF